MQNQLLKFRQRSIISEKRYYFFEKLKTLTSSNCHSIEFNIFCWNFEHVSYLTISTKGSSRSFLILFRSWVIEKPHFRECVESSSFFILANNSRSKQNKKTPEHHFIDIGVQNFKKFIKVYGTWTSSKFQIF